MTLHEFWNLVGTLPPETLLLVDAPEYGLDRPTLVEVKTVAAVRERNAWSGPFDTEFDPLEGVVGEPFVAIILRR